MKNLPVALLLLAAGGFSAASAQNAPVTPAAAPAAPAPGPTATPTTPPPAPAASATGALYISEDFESGKINPDVWDLRVSGAATATIVQDKVAHGKNALKIHYPAGTRGAYAMLAAKLPAGVHDQLYGRAYVYATNLPVQNHSVFLSAGTPGWPKANFLEIGDDTGAFKLSFKLDNRAVPVNGFTNGEVNPKGGTIPQDRWMCLEWEFTDKPADRIIITVDGKPVVDKNQVFHNSTGGLVNGFVEFAIGFRTFAAANLVPKDVDVYYDDIAISDKPIGQLAPVPAEPKPAAAVTP